MYAEALADPNLDPAVRALLTEKVTLGKGRAKRTITRPKMEDSYQVLSNKGETDAAEMPVASSEPDFRDDIDDLADILAEKFDLLPGQARGLAEFHKKAVNENVEREVSIKLARTACFIFREQNKEQAHIAFLFATRTASVNGFKSMRAAAKTIPKEIPTMAKGTVTVASLSKVTNRLCSFVGLPTGEGMKSDASVEIYSKTQTKKHKERKDARLSKALELLDQQNHD